MKVNTIKEVLIAARWIIDNVGWCQGSYGMDKKGNRLFGLNQMEKDASNVGAVCSIGAIMMVEASDEIKNETENFLDSVLDEAHHSHTIRWNDCKEHTKKDILEVFDLAISKAE